MIWNRSEIRAARQSPLKPVCEALGYRLEHIRDGNYRVLGCRLPRLRRSAAGLQREL